MKLLRIPLALAFSLCVLGAMAAGPGSNGEPPTYRITPGNSYNPVGYGLPTVLVVRYADASGHYHGQGVRLLAGTAILNPALPEQGDWDILPGTALRRDQRPPWAVHVRLFTGTGAARQLLCTIDVRYYRTRLGGWQPWYMLDSAKNGVWYNNKFRSFYRGTANAPLLYNAYDSLPNGEGYYASLSLKSSAGPVSIDSWVTTIEAR